MSAAVDQTARDTIDEVVTVSKRQFTIQAVLTFFAFIGLLFTGMTLAELRKRIEAMESKLEAKESR